MSNRKTKKKRSIAYGPNVGEFIPFPTSQILSINIRVTCEVLKFQRESSSSSVQCIPQSSMLPLASIQRDDVGSAGYHSCLTPAGGANMRAALVVTGRCDDAARCAAC